MEVPAGSGSESNLGPCERLCTLLTSHAVEALKSSDTNLFYAQQVLAKTIQVRQLLKTGGGAVSGVVMTWRQNFIPVAESVFGESWARDDNLVRSGQSSGMLPTVFDGIRGRVSVVSLDEIMGPCLSLDLMGVSAVPIE